MATLGSPDPVSLRRAASTLAGRPVPMRAVSSWLGGLGERRSRVRALLESPGIPQRTDAWYSARETLVTASDLQKLLDCGAQAYCRKKAEMAGMWDYLGKQPAIRWGKKFEPVAAEIYGRRTGAAVHDFGLLLHPDIPGFGASPDGITGDGVMLEIKCPYSRKLAGPVPPAYYAQIQGQLDTAGLDLCDYFEVRLGEYLTEADFLGDGFDGACLSGADDCLTEQGLEKGAMFLGGSGGPPSDDWVVCPERESAEAVAEWVRARKSGDPSGTATYWYLIDSNLVRVGRDPGFMDAARPLVAECKAILTAVRDGKVCGATGGAATGGAATGGGVGGGSFAGHSAPAGDGVGAGYGSPAGSLPSFAFLGLDKGAPGPAHSGARKGAPSPAHSGARQGAPGPACSGYLGGSLGLDPRCDKGRDTPRDQGIDPRRVRTGLPSFAFLL